MSIAAVASRGGFPVGVSCLKEGVRVAGKRLLTKNKTLQIADGSWGQQSGITGDYPSAIWDCPCLPWMNPCGKQGSCGKHGVVNMDDRSIDGPYFQNPRLLTARYIFPCPSMRQCVVKSVVMYGVVLRSGQTPGGPKRMYVPLVDPLLLVSILKTNAGSILG